MITIVDYGLGNIGSIRNMLKRVGCESCIASSEADLESATKLILPGVGHFDKAMSNIINRGLLNILNKKALIEKIPILGICLGMQLLADTSEEGTMEGLGWVPGNIVKFKQNDNELLKIPHMGWNTIDCLRETPLTKNFSKDHKFYFVHSYYFVPNDPDASILKTYYSNWFTSGINYKNIYGVQFHPEKSHKYGMGLLKNFSLL